MAARGLTGAEPDQFAFQAPDVGRCPPRRLLATTQPAASGNVSRLSGSRVPPFAPGERHRAGGRRTVFKTAKTRLGHRDPRLTIATYAQAVAAADRRAADILGPRGARAMEGRSRSRTQ